MPKIRPWPVCMDPEKTRGSSIARCRQKVSASATAARKVFVSDGDITVALWPKGLRAAVRPQNSDSMSRTPTSLPSALELDVVGPRAAGRPAPVRSCAATETRRQQFRPRRKEAFDAAAPAGTGEARRYGLPKAVESLRLERGFVIAGGSMRLFSSANTGVGGSAKPPWRLAVWFLTVLLGCREEEKIMTRFLDRHKDPAGRDRERCIASDLETAHVSGEEATKRCAASIPRLDGCPHDAKVEPRQGRIRCKEEGQVMGAEEGTPAYFLSPTSRAK